MDFKPIRNADVHPYVVKAGQTIAPAIRSVSTPRRAPWLSGAILRRSSCWALPSLALRARWPATRSVYDNPDCVFMATADAAIAQTTVNIACDVIGTSGDNFLVDIGTTTTAQWKVVDLLQNVDPLTATAKPRGCLVKPVKRLRRFLIPTHQRPTRAPAWL